MSAPAKAAGRPALELCEEAAFLLRRAPAGAWTIYFAGAGPFLLGLLYFWTDMTRGVFQEAKLVGGSLALAILFIWMKTCQSMFAQRLWAFLSKTPREPETPGRWARVALAQARLQPWGFFALPVAAALTVPFAWVFAYFQNVTVLGATAKDSERTLHQVAFEQARLWPKQNHCALTAITALGFVIFINVMILLILTPQILITFLGVKEAFHPSFWIAFNTTFLAMVTSLTYLAVDPLIKALYTLRCFYGESIVTGEDLRARLAMARSIRKPARNVSKVIKIAALLLFLGTGMTARSIENSGSSQKQTPVSAVAITPQQLDQKISETLEGPEYNWRFPRIVPPEKRSGWLHDFIEGVWKWIGGVLKRIGHWIEDFFNWLGRKFSFRPPAPSMPNMPAWSWPSLTELLVLFALIIVIMAMVMIVRRRRFRLSPQISARPAQAIPDLNDENVIADQLPEDQWLEMSARLAGQGDLRLAIRALFLGALAGMAGKNLIALALFKSNRDYEREFKRRGAAIPGAVAAFGSLVMIYNEIWYGLHEPSPEHLHKCQESVRALRL